MTQLSQDYTYQPVVNMDGTSYVNTGSVLSSAEPMITGGGHGGGDMSDSVSDLIQEVKKDLRLLLGGACTAFVLLCGGIATSYLLLSNQTRDVTEHIWNVEKSQAIMNGKLDTLDVKISAKLDSISERLDAQSAAGLRNKHP